MKLNPGFFKDRRSRNLGKYTVHRSRGAVVTVANGVCDQIAVGVEQAVINRPAIDADAVNRPSKFVCPHRRLNQSGLDLAEDQREIPPQMAAFDVRRILESMNFFKEQVARIDSGEKNPSAARTQINRDIKWTRHHRLS